jgi:hypothetical protein
VSSCASRSLRISIRKRVLGRYDGAAGIEAGAAVLDRVSAVGRQRLAGLEPGAGQTFGLRPFTG